MQLAALMRCSVDELGERFSGQEFGLWDAFLEVEPIGPSAVLSMFAEVLAALANGPLKPPQGRNAFRSSDFMKADRWKRPAPVAAPTQPTAHDIQALFKQG